MHTNIQGNHIVSPMFSDVLALPQKNAANALALATNRAFGRGET